MIKLTEQFSIYRDKYNWILVELVEGKDKHGNPKTHPRETYHPWFDSAVRYAADHSCQGAKVFRDVEKRHHELETSIRAAGKAVSEGIAPVLAELAEVKAALAGAERQLKKGVHQ